MLAAYLVLYPRARIQSLVYLGFFYQLLAVLLLAVSVVIGSGANFTSQSANPSNTFTAGNLTHLNSKNGAALFTVTKMKPGDIVSLPGRLSDIVSRTLAIQAVPGPALLLSDQPERFPGDGIAPL